MQHNYRKPNSNMFVGKKQKSIDTLAVASLENLELGTTKD